MSPEGQRFWGAASATGGATVSQTPPGPTQVLSLCASKWVLSCLASWSSRGREGLGTLRGETFSWGQVFFLGLSLPARPLFQGPLLWRGPRSLSVLVFTFWTREVNGGEASGGREGVNLQHLHGSEGKAHGRCAHAQLGSGSARARARHLALHLRRGIPAAAAHT